MSAAKKRRDVAVPSKRLEEAQGRIVVSGTGTGYFASFVDQPTIDAHSAGGHFPYDHGYFERIATRAAQLYVDRRASLKKLKEGAK